MNEQGEIVWQWYGLHSDFNAGAYNGEEGTFLLTATVSVQCTKSSESLA